MVTPMSYSDISINKLEPGHVYVDVDMVATILPVVDQSSLEHVGSLVGPNNTRVQVRGPCSNCGKMANLGRGTFAAAHSGQWPTFPNRKMKCWNCSLESGEGVLTCQDE